MDGAVQDIDNNHDDFNKSGVVNMTEIELKGKISGKLRVTLLDGEHVPDYETYLRLKESGELTKYIISEEVCEV